MGYAQLDRGLALPQGPLKFIANRGQKEHSNHAEKNVLLKLPKPIGGGGGGGVSGGG